jgi:hypothetical protein
MLLLNETDNKFLEATQLHFLKPLPDVNRITAPKEAGGKFSSKLHGVTTQKSACFVLTAMENAPLEFFFLFHDI